MRISLALLAFTATSVLAQIPGLPSCAQSCITIPAGCQTTDFKCICADKSFITNISCCVAGACDTADQQTIIKFAAGLCGGYGVTVPTVAGCSGSAATSAAASETAASGSSAGSASGASVSVTAFALTAGNGTVMTTTATVTAVSTTTTTASASSVVAATTAGAMSYGPQAGVLLGGVMAGMALL